MQHTCCISLGLMRNQMQGSDPSPAPMPFPENIPAPQCLSCHEGPQTDPRIPGVVSSPAGTHLWSVAPWNPAVPQALAQPQPCRCGREQEGQWGPAWHGPQPRAWHGTARHSSARHRCRCHGPGESGLRGTASGLISQRGALITGTVPAFVLQPRAGTGPSLSRPYRQRGKHSVNSFPSCCQRLPTHRQRCQHRCGPRNGTSLPREPGDCDRPVSHGTHASPSAAAPACRSHGQPGALGLCRVCWSKH